MIACKNCQSPVTVISDPELTRPFLRGLFGLNEPVHTSGYFACINVDQAAYAFSLYATFPDGIEPHITSEPVEPPAPTPLPGTVINIGEAFTLRYPDGHMVAVSIEASATMPAGALLVNQPPKLVAHPATAPVFLEPVYHTQAVEYAPDLAVGD